MPAREHTILREEQYDRIHGDRPRVDMRSQAVADARPPPLTDARSPPLAEEFSATRPPTRMPGESEDHFYDRFERFYEVKRRLEHEERLRREREGFSRR